MDYRINEEQIDLLIDYFEKEFSGSASISFEKKEIQVWRKQKKIFSLPLKEITGNEL